MKIVLQDGIKDCGICCLLSIIRFYGGEVSKEYLREITHTTKEGVTLYDLMQGAKQIGFEAIGVAGKIENIKTNNLPCIVHVIINKSYQHFVVLYQINHKKQQVTLMDPAKGKKTISFSEYRLLTSSNYLLLKPLKKLPVMKKKNIIYQNIKTNFKKHKKLLLLIILLTLSYFILNIASSFQFKYIMEYSINYKLSNNISDICTIVLFICFIKNTNQTLKNVMLNKWSSVFDESTTLITYKQLLLLPYLYYKNRTSGEIVSRFKDLNTIRNFISNLFCVLTTELITLILFGLLIFKINSFLSLIIFILLLIVIIYNLIYKNKKTKTIRRISKNQDRVNSYLIQGLSNVDTIKGSHLEKRMIDKFSLYYKSFLESIYKYNLWQELYNFIKSNINDLIYTLIYIIGAINVINSKFSLSTLIIYQSLFSYFIESFYQIIYIIEDYPSFKIALDRVEELFMITKDNFENNYFYLPYQLKGDIKYNNLEYQVGTKKLFNKLDWTINEGEKILLSGESGCGKSTLLKMLLRYVDAPFRSISIANIDINHYHLENIRANITYVTSGEYLFPDSIKNNILLYREYKEEDFVNVCKICLLDDLIKNNMTGYDSIIEENGLNYSNGERQRIILARSIIRKSSIYIFDEAFSGIDISKEKKILTNIFEYLHDKTIIVISHRFNNKKLFDRVCRLEKGKIHES